MDAAHTQAQEDMIESDLPDLESLSLIEVMAVEGSALQQALARVVQELRDPTQIVAGHSNAVP